MRERVRASGFETCFVVNERGVVLGRLGRQALGADDDATVEVAMTAGPGTVRPDLSAAAAAKRMRERNLPSMLVTHSDGTLIGLLRREDAEAAAG